MMMMMMMMNYVHGRCLSPVISVDEDAVLQTLKVACGKVRCR